MSNANLNRNLHRDIAYFYVGLIISFAASGIALNHRRIWSPMNYTYESKEIKAQLPDNEEKIDKEFVNNLVTEKLALAVDVTGFRVERGMLRIFVKDGLIEISQESGIGKAEFYRKRPLLGQMTLLHVNTDNWWIYYSDFFGIAMITIATTGMFISKGATSFSKRGWKLALGGILFPLIFLIFIG